MMMKAGTTTSSPLGLDSKKFDELCPRTGHIWDNTEEGRIVLRPAGFTKQDEKLGYLPRQEYFKRLYERAAALGDIENLYPLPDREYEIQLRKEPQNEHDSTAVRIFCTFSPIIGTIYMDLGYIPQKISQKIFLNYQRIRDVLIYSVEANVHEKYYVANLALVYVDPKISPETIAADRMASVMED